MLMKFFKHSWQHFQRANFRARTRNDTRTDAYNASKEPKEAAIQKRDARRSMVDEDVPTTTLLNISFNSLISVVVVLEKAMRFLH